MELNNTWSGFQRNLKSVDMVSFRGDHTVRKIPLYEVHDHPFYKDSKFNYINKFNTIEYSNHYRL